MNSAETKKGDALRLAISGSDFGLLIKALVGKNASAKFPVTGKSMFPNILSGDILTLVPYRNRTPKVGDVVCLTVPKTRQIIIHRIIRKCDDCLLIKGDNFFRADGVFDTGSVLGYVSHIERDNKIFAVGRLQNLKNLLLSRLRFFNLYRLLFFNKGIYLC